MHPGKQLKIEHEIKTQLLESEGFLCFLRANWYKKQNCVESLKEEVIIFSLSLTVKLENFEGMRF